MNAISELALAMMMTASSASVDTIPGYLALGDSYTIGESVAVNQRWPMQLAGMLRARGLKLADPQIIAVTGWTTDELEAGMQQADLERCYGLVSLSIGVNNQYRQRDLENFRQEYNRLLQRAIDLAGGNTQRVFVLSIPDWSVTPFAETTGRNLGREAANLAAYNQAKRDITGASGVAFFDITPSTLMAANDTSLLATDGLHPSGKLYTLWVGQIIDSVQAMLETGTNCPPPK
jgi:lysophospholipase L1-like esterase